MTSLKPYSLYKVSGIPWIGNVPEHWQVKRNRYLLREIDRRSETGNEPLLSVSQYTGVTRRADALAENSPVSRAASLEGYKIVESGDLVVNIMLAWNGSLGFSNYDGIVSPAYGVYRVSRACHPRYLHYWLRTPAYLANIKVESTGVVESRLRLYTDSLYGLRSLVPPLDEQRAIANFLDGMDARITRFIAARRKMIALLEEEKQAVINQAITRGLDLNVPMKDSGVDWLGEIPAHWAVPQIGHFSRVGNGSTPSRSNYGYWTSEGFPWLNSGSVHSGLITSTNQFVTPLALVECHLPVVEPGDLLVAITGQGKTRGTAAIVGLTATINQHMAYIKVRSPKINSTYLHKVLSAAYRTLRDLSSDSGSTKGALTCADIRHFRVPIPPLQEQEKTVEHLDRETSRIASLISRHRREIELMQEYRTRLISDVVTGKLDVRGVELPPVEKVIGEEIEAAMEDETVGELVGELEYSGIEE